MVQIAFTIPGRLGGKGRARSTIIPGRAGKKAFVSNYTPPETRATEAMIREIAQRAMVGVPLFDGAVELTVLIFQTMPPSWSKKRQQASVCMTVKPDADNVVKAIGDACNLIVWRDDVLISDLHVKRRYVRDGGKDRVEIVVCDAPDERILL